MGTSRGNDRYPIPKKNMQRRFCNQYSVKIHVIYNITNIPFINYISAVSSSSFGVLFQRFVARHLAGMTHKPGQLRFPAQDTPPEFKSRGLS